MQMIEVWGKQKDHTAFSARKIPTGELRASFGGQKIRFFREKQQ